MNEATGEHGAGVLELLAPFRAWQLNRVSVTTYPNDVAVTIRRKGQPLSEAETKTITDYIRSGTCYRCRIGKGRFFFGTTARAAVELAVAAATITDRQSEGTP